MCCSRCKIVLLTAESIAFVETATVLERLCEICAVIALLAGENVHRTGPRCPICAKA